MATLETRTAKINVVISLKGVDNIDIIKERLLLWCQQYTQTYAFILHDKDILETGEKKTNHIHLVALLKTNRTRLGTTLTTLSNALIINVLAISIDKMSDLVGSLQYLIHKNNKEKHPYDLKDITTNISDGEMKTYMNSDSKSMSIEYLIGVVTKNQSLIEIMRTIGLANYHLYRNVIKDIYSEYWG